MDTRDTAPTFATPHARAAGAALDECAPARFSLMAQAEGGVHLFFRIPANTDEGMALDRMLSLAQPLLSGAADTVDFAFSGDAPALRERLVRLAEGMDEESAWERDKG